MGAKQKRKRPVTMEMLTWLRRRLDAGEVGDAARWAAISVAFFSMLRLPEYLAEPAKPGAENRALLGGDANPRLEGAPAPPSAQQTKWRYT